MKILEISKAARALTKNAQSFDGNELIKEARAVGEKLFGKSHSGLVFANKVEVMSARTYGSVYDTFDYVFRPKPLDVADYKVLPEHAVNGVIFVGGADGVKLLTAPGIRVSLTNVPELDMEEIGGIWKVHGADGYDYVVGPYKHKILPTDMDEAWEIIKTGKWGVFNPTKIERPTDKEIKEYIRDYL